MRIGLLTTFLLILSFHSSYSYGQEMTLSSGMRNYMIACSTMSNAVRDKDKTLMESALEMLDNINISLIPQESIHCKSTENVLKPDIFFLPEYADKLLLDNFVIADLDESSLLRDVMIDPDILVSHHAIKGKGSASFEIDGAGKMELLVTSDGKTAPVIHVFDRQNGKEYKNYNTSGNSSWMIWHMENGGFFDLTVENNDDDDVTFVIALN